jgi:glycosyltransferase involved in cell wall biosynthesis
MIVVTVAGWIRLLHSFSVVNRNQLFWLGQNPDIDLYVYEPEPVKASWLNHQIEPWWDEESREFFLNLRFVSAPVKGGILLDYSYPFDHIENFDGPWFRFVVTEFGLLRSNFARRHDPLVYFDRPNMTIVTPSNWSAGRLTKHGLHQDRIKVIPHGFNPDIFFSADQDERKRFRSNLALDKEHFVILNLGALTWNKGVDILVKAFVQFALDHPKAILILKDQVNLYGISGTTFIQDLFHRHHLPGQVLSQIKIISSDLNDVQLRSLYCSANVYVTPYRAEGFNLPALEAMACGTPVLCTSNGASDDYTYPKDRLPSKWHRLENLPRELKDDLIDCEGNYTETSVIEVAEALTNAYAQRQDNSMARPGTDLSAFSWQAVIRPLYHMLSQ